MTGSAQNYFWKFVHLENSCNFMSDLEFFWYDKSIYARFDTVTAVSHAS